MHLTALLLAAHDGEVTGAALFRALGEGSGDDRERSVYALLEQVEDVTRSIMAPVLARAGLAPGSEAWQAGLDLAAALAGEPWHEVCRQLRPVVEQALADYQALRGLGGPLDRPALEALVAHEQALLDFLVAELGGLVTSSTAPLTAYLAGYATSPQVVT